MSGTGTGSQDPRSPGKSGCVASLSCLFTSCMAYMLIGHPLSLVGRRVFRRERAEKASFATRSDSGLELLTLFQPPGLHMDLVPLGRIVVLSASKYGAYPSLSDPFLIRQSHSAGLLPFRNISNDPSSQGSHWLERPWEYVHTMSLLPVMASTEFPFRLECQILAFT